MGILGRNLDHYRQFADPDPLEESARLRDAYRRSKELQAPEPVDLSRTEWPEPPHPDVVQAVVFAARGGINRQPDREARALRAQLATRHGLAAERIVVGSGAAELIAAMASSLLGPGRQLVTAWPSYPLYPLLAERAGAEAVPVPLAEGRIDLEAVAAAVGPETGLVTLCNPNDPSGDYLTAAELDGFLRAIPAGPTVVVDEAFVELQTVEDPEASVALLEAHPQLVLVRTFSKAHGLSGLRIGYALGAPGAAPALERLAPVLGVSVLAQAGAAEALRLPEELERRRAAAAARRGLAVPRLLELGFEVAPSETHFLWARPPLPAAELVGELDRRGLHVQPGAGLGDPERVRITLRSERSDARLLRALGEMIGERTRP